MQLLLPMTQNNEVIGRSGKGYGARIAFDLDLQEIQVAHKEKPPSAEAPRRLARTA